ncbi:MAG: hypothetical protein R2686_06985 [Candidatus Nanopelagicales bacterium]
MTALTAPFRRINTGRGHRYVDANNTKVPGVTTLLSGGLPKPALTNWAARTAAEYAVDNWDRLAGEKPSRRLDEIRGAPWASRDAAALRGTKLHTAAEQLQLTGTADVEEEQLPLVESYLRFVEDWQPQVTHTESAVYNITHGYAGTLDLIADLCDGQTWLLDLKTSKGVYGDMALQLAAYRYAEFINDGDDHHPMPTVDAVGIVHVRADGYDLVPVVAGAAQFRAFLYVAQVAKTAASLDELVGSPLTPNKVEVTA